MDVYLFIQGPTPARVFIIKSWLLLYSPTRLTTLCLLVPQGDSVPTADDSPFADTVTLEQKTNSIGGTSGKVSLWMQWMLPKVTVKLFAPEATAKTTGTLINLLNLFLLSNTTTANFSTFMLSCVLCLSAAN